MNQGKFVIFISMLLGSFVTFGQDFLATVRHYGVSDGLSQREVYSIHEDSKGFIWFGTKFGLNRFDGYHFKWYSREKNGLSSNTIHYIMEDAAHRLWLFEGDSWYHKTPHTQISVFDANQEKAIDIPETKNLLEARTLTGYLSSPSLSLYFSHARTLIHYRPETGFQSYPFSVPGDFQIQYYAHDDHIWGVKDKKSLVEMDTLGKVISQIPLGSLAKEDTWIKIKGEDKDGLLLFTVFYNQNSPLGKSKHELFKVDRNGNFTYPNEQIGLAHVYPPIWGGGYFYQPQRELFWYKVSPYFFAFNQEKGVIYDFSLTYPNLSNTQIHQVYFDKSDRIWMGNTEGLYQINLNLNPFQRILFQNPLDQSPAKQISCRGLWIEDNILHINSYSGVFTYNLADKSVTKRPYYKGLYKGKSDVIFYDPLAVKKDRNGNFWYGEERLIKRDSINQLSSYESDESQSFEIWSLYEDADGVMWVGTSLGLMYLDIASGKLLNWHQDVDKQKIWAFVEAPGGDSCYLATYRGVYVFEPRSGKLRLLSDPADKTGLLQADIRHLHIDQEGILWMASYGSGLIKWDRKQGLIRNYTLADGLANNNLYAVYEDAQHNLWMSSDYGIIAFNKQTRTTKGYLLEDGITDNEFNSISHFQAADGQLFFGGLNGITAFYPTLLPFEQDTVIHRLQITDFKKYDIGVDSVINLTQAINRDSRIVMKPGERFFEIEFSLLSFDEPDLIRYSYTIEGLDNNWHQMLKRSLQISGLPYGEYTLRVKGLPNGQFSAQELLIPIQVIQPFYTQGWFITGVILLFIGLVFGWYKVRTRNLLHRQIRLEKQVKARTFQIQEAQKLQAVQNQQLAKQAEELKELDTLKSRFFANVSHEFRTPLTLILGPLESIISRSREEKTKKELSNMRQHAQSLLNLISRLLDLSKLEAGKMELQAKSEDIIPLLRRTFYAFESLAMDKEIQLTFVSASPAIELYFDAEKIQSVLMNLLSNAFKFTPRGGQISLEVQLVGQAEAPTKLSIELTDSGTGISENELQHLFERFYQGKDHVQTNQLSTGIGLALSKEFVDLHKGELLVRSKAGKGSTFTILLPFGKAHLKPGEIVEQRMETSTGPGESFLLPSRLSEEALPAEAGFNKEDTLILLVEDNDDMRAFIHQQLTEKYQVVEAIHGKEGMEKAIEIIPDLIISDLMMPEMDGLELCQLVKNDERTSHIPIILLTARDDIESRLAGLEQGADAYLSKPFNQAELFIRIEKMIEMRRKLQARYASILPEAAAPVKKNLIENTFLQKIWQLLEAELDNPNFTIPDLCEKLNISQSQLYRKVKAITGKSIAAYIRSIRLEHGRKILIETDKSIAETAYAVGFNDPSYFSRSFSEEFGFPPSDFRK